MYPKSRYFFVLFLSLAFLSLNAQHEADYWYFGYYAGLDFSSGNPEPLTEGQLKSYEGCATASDSAGNLLFYTDGVTVWNKEHQIMENGNDLFGDSSSTQSAIMVPHPGNDSLYYIFTSDVLRKHEVPNYIHKGFNFSIINTKLNNNLGEVIDKNSLLLDSVCEKITAVKHQNNSDFWIISHEWGNNKFYSWLIDENGINTSPVISTTNNVHLGADTLFAAAVGNMKSSTEGDKIVLGIQGLFAYDILDFDKLTGTLTDYFSINLGFPVFTYGCEFSPDGSKLYFTQVYKVHQVDMNAGTPADIINSMTEICEFSTPVGAMQLAKNGKLYISVDNSEYLSVINDPNELPADCNFELDAVFLDNRKARLGLPNFNQSYFKEADFSAENICLFDSTHFVIENISDIDSVIWNFDDPASGSLNISRELSPIHIYQNTGIYKVKLTVWFNNVSSYHFENIKIVALPKIDLGEDTTFCLNDSYILNAEFEEPGSNSDHRDYLWSDLSAEPFLKVKTSGTYWVNVRNIYTTCKNSDTIHIIFSDLPEIDLGPDTSFCENTVFFIDAYHDGYTYLWQDNSTESYFPAINEGSYFLTVANEDGCINADTINLELNYIPKFSFNCDTVLCDGTELYLTFDFEDAQYFWSDGSTESNRMISEAGRYILTVQNICGSHTDSICVRYEYCGELYIPNIFSPNSDEINDCFFIKGINYGIWPLEIYNRWGQKVIQFADYENTWYGKDMFGRDLHAGVYYYVLRNLGEVYRGTVRIVR